ncbi:transcription-repair coupling factor (superfamily II helicase) [Sphingomonas jejuensis]|uniref:Transcription-repair-coupling factor n=1 Tax=Sphingomonas jejuensis TaxID=904715 RepID=A0ABX0XIQ9_9SPHN|nr:helicase-related protein [Sphingomonas jejuensis]NJC33222.1 transcription-repair coupling factor (superfamily II helicase) [Sphingomonas jejuensis]
MLKKTTDAALRAADATVPVAVAAAQLVDSSTSRILLAADEQRAGAIAAIAAAMAPNAVVIHLAASDALPGDSAPPSPANVGQRVAAMRRLRMAATDKGAATVLLVTSAEAGALRVPAPEAFDRAPPCIRTGDTIDLEAFADTAIELGYIVDDRIDEPGEVAVRGAVVDIFPADRDAPVRIEAADGVVASIRHYDPVTQLGTDEVAEVAIGRATEPPLGDGVSLLDHVPGAGLLIDGDAEARRDRFLALAGDGGRRRRAARELVDRAAWEKAKAGRDAVAIEGEAGDPPPRFVEHRDPLRAFKRFAKAALDDGALLIVGSARDIRFLAPRLGLDLQPVASFGDALTAKQGRAMTLVAPVERGFVVGGLTVVAASDLLGSRALVTEAQTSVVDAAFGRAGELHPGDVVVHEEFGIGVVQGLEPAPGGEGDCIMLEYARDARRLVPVADAGRIWRYGADRDAVTLDALDGGSWQKRRVEIDAAIAESARALSELAAERDTRRTDPIVPDTADYEKFSAGFPFAETPDQARAIAAVRSDMASGRPMDRLVVGDVGYGKTEVAMRAAALAALAGRQVAVVAPTTVLVRQHLDAFAARFRESGIAVAGLSRLSTPAERKRVKAGLADGSIRVVVGTGAIGGKGVTFADLALVVIDEEQRFGAKDKATLRALGAGHVLTLSATPIPRTLQSALIGLQSISVIATPPARRQPIRTTVAAFDDEQVRKALLREHARGGQSFVVVPRIEDIDPLATKLARLVPDLSVVVAHGKMPVDALDSAMVDFAAGDGDILLATNIIEAGLDVPRANTMIVHRADRFGLSQLHQLRGRVGRGGRRGQIMLLTEGDATIGEATLKRLRTLQAFDRLGAGFAISARDLDLRGAGDLIGDAQAGHMKLIGVDLYQHLLGHALRVARGEAEDRWWPTLNLQAAGRLPESWVPEPDLRLSLYGRLSRLEEPSDVDAFEAELEDRFGPIPPEAARLLRTARIAALAEIAGVRQVDAGPGAIAVTPVDRRAEPPAPFAEEKGRWLVRERIEDPDARAERVMELLEALAAGD